MVITVINGSTDDTRTGFVETLAHSTQSLAKAHDVRVFTIKDMDIAFCCGCFTCWERTPGLCVFKDDMDGVLRRIVQSDLLVFVSPIVAGFISAHSKKVMDRLLPMVLPYVRVIDGESHHPGRYEKDRNLGVVLIDDGNMDEVSKKIAFDHIDRLSLNFHSIKPFKAVATGASFEEVFANEIGHY